MTRRIVIVGAGHAGVQLAESLRDEGFTGELVLLGDEDLQPYQRPPLTKDYLHGDIAAATLLPLRAEQVYRDRLIDLRPGSSVVAIEPEARRVLLADGTHEPYDELVLATGARSRPFPPAGSAPAHVHAIRDAADAESFARDLEAAQALAIVGAGFIGLEVAAAARARGVGVTVVSSRPPLARVATPELSAYLNGAHEAMGTRILNEEAVRLEEHADGVAVLTGTGARLAADLALVAIGAVPNAELAVQAGLTVAGGVVTDRYARSSDPRVWAIGDVAVRSAPDGSLARDESVQSATHQARCLARTLTGRPTAPFEVPWYWSTQAALRLQIAGVPYPGAETVVRGSVEDDRFSVFGFVAGRLRVVESVNAAADHLAARRLLATRIPLTPEQASDPGFDLKAYSLQAAPG